MPDDGTENLFFHATDVEGCTIFDLKPGDAVEYEPGINEKGPCGRKVRRVV
jgi:cold shock CspA family protein